jgi:hypothetical protein
MREAQARICLRKEGQPTSTVAIRGWLEQNERIRISTLDIRAAIDSGEEVGLGN